MSGYLLDTNVVGELRKGDRADPGVRAWIADRRPSELLLSVLTIGELRRGVLLVGRRDPAQALRLQTWLEEVVASGGDRILPVDHRVAARWAQMGVPDPRPVIDALLAATAAVHDLVLVTRNGADVAGTGVEVFDPFARP